MFDVRVRECLDTCRRALAIGTLARKRYFFRCVKVVLALESGRTRQGNLPAGLAEPCLVESRCQSFSNINSSLLQECSSNLLFSILVYDNNFRIDIIQVAAEPTKSI